MKRSMGMEKLFREEKRMRLVNAGVRNTFDVLSDDLIISILTKNAISANSPSDLLGIMLSCKRMKKLGMNPIVLWNASWYAISIRARSWCNGAHQFLRQCVDAGNTNTSFLLGMIEFYCLGHYARGAYLLVQAAKSSTMAFFCLASIRYIVSGKRSIGHFPHDLDPVLLWAKSVVLGQVDDIITAIGYSLRSYTDNFFKICSHCGLFVQEPTYTGLDLQLVRQARLVNLLLTEWWHLPDVKSNIEHGQEFSEQLCDLAEMMSDSLYACMQKRYKAAIRAKMYIGRLKSTAYMICT